MNFYQPQNIILVCSIGLNTYFFREILHLKEILENQRNMSTIFQEATEKKIYALEKLSEIKNIAPKIEALSNQSSNISAGASDVITAFLGVSIVLTVSGVIVYAMMPLVPKLTDFFFTKVCLLFGTFPNDHNVIVKNLSTDTTLGLFKYQQSMEGSINHILYLPSNSVQRIILSPANFDAALRSHVEQLTINAGSSQVQQGAEMMMIAVQIAS